MQRERAVEVISLRRIKNMEITLEKIELVKDRTGVTYAEAKQALEENDGSVVDAIIDIEETVNAGKKESGIGDKGAAVFDKLKELVKKGNVARILVKKDDEIVLNAPVNAGIVGIAIAPLASVVAAVAAFGFKYTIEVVKTDGTIIDVSDAVSDTVSNVAEKSSEAAGLMRDKATELYEKGKSAYDEYSDKVKDSDIYGKAKDTAGGLKDKAEDFADDLKDRAEDLADKAKDRAEDLADRAKDKAEDLADKAKDKADGFKNKAGEAVEEAEEAAEETAEEVVEEAEDAVEEAAEEVKEAAEDEE